jgi:hypothetical protein
MLMTSSNSCLTMPAELPVRLLAEEPHRLERVAAADQHRRVERRQPPLCLVLGQRHREYGPLRGHRHFDQQHKQRL